MILAVRTNKSGERELTTLLKATLIADYAKELDGKRWRMITKKNESGYGVDVILEIVEKEEKE